MRTFSREVIVDRQTDRQTWQETFIQQRVYNHLTNELAAKELRGIQSISHNSDWWIGQSGFEFELRGDFCLRQSAKTIAEPPIGVSFACGKPVAEYRYLVNSISPYSSSSISIISEIVKNMSPTLISPWAISLLFIFPPVINSTSNPNSRGYTNEQSRQLAVRSQVLSSRHTLQ